MKKETQFKKGKSGNPNGRPKGTPNKTTEETRERFKELLAENFDKIQEDLEQLAPDQRIKVLLDLAKFVLPTLRSTELTTIEDSRFNPIVVNFSNNLNSNENENTN